MDGTPRVGGYRRSRRSRSQRDRERKLAVPGGREPRPYTPSSGSEQEGAEGAGSSRPRPPRRRRRDSASCEEDVIDGFAIASFISLETLEKEAALKPPERAEGQRKRPDKRRSEEHGTSWPGEGCRANEGSDAERARQNGEQEGKKAPPAKKVKMKGQSHGNESTGGENGSSYRSSSRGPGSEESVHSSLGTGYFCDIDSDPDEKSVCNDPVRCPKLEDPPASPHGVPSVWKSSLLAAGDEGLSKLFSTATKIAPGLCSSLTPLPDAKVSGLDRSRERSQESDREPPPAPRTPSRTPAAAAVPIPQPGPPAPDELRPAGDPRQPSPQAPVPAQTQALPRVQPFAQGYGGSRSSTPSKPLAPSSQLPHRASTPSSLSLGLSSHPGAHGFAPALRPPSHPHHPGVYTPSPGLPPPPPLTSAIFQVAGHPSPASAAAFSEQELIRQELNSRYLSSQGPERGSSLGPPSFQFHQHQHTHQHTHQHFAPYPPIAQASLVPAPAAPMYFQTYHAASPAVPTVLPTTGPFSSLQGAFQPKTPNTELASRPGPIPHALLRKDPRLTEVYRPQMRKQGKWCAMHVRIAWMIHRHQEKNKMLQVEHQKLDLAKADLLSRGASVFSPITPAHELARPITLFTATGAVHPATSPFVPPSALSPFLNAAPHLDPYTRSPSYSAIGQLPNAAFGGLGNPAVASAVFAPKECPAAPGYGSSRDQWNRLHQTPPSFPTPPPPPPWPRLGEPDRERERVLPSEKEAVTDRHEVLLLRDEKERDGPYPRHHFRVTDEERGPPALPPHPPSAGSLSERRHPHQREKRDRPWSESRLRDRRRVGGLGQGEEDVGGGEEEGGDPPRRSEAAGAGCEAASGSFPGLRAIPLPVLLSHGHPHPHQPAELGLLERGRLLGGPYLRLGQPPPYPWDTWRDLTPLPPPHHPHHHCPARDDGHPPPRDPPPPREDYEQRARLIAGGFLAPSHPHPPHPYPRLSPSLLLPKTPPIGAPPPLVSSSSTHSSSSAPSSRGRSSLLSDPRDFPPHPHKERDAR
ncbi:autism susceptibility gene 2 protein homolog isoform X2 [Pristis pectinata]|uniref:autism susceptibility gene 2 protein homolog isoform X2 n=1 Tax=Pristis pectinata TaxID=685728 RepID=UPI00223D0963|nr:autism susceptibility gene 2 protein homolog isoform X2 [Pristis pectinata]